MVLMNNAQVMNTDTQVNKTEGLSSLCPKKTHPFNAELFIQYRSSQSQFCGVKKYQNIDFIRLNHRGQEKHIYQCWFIYWPVQRQAFIWTKAGLLSITYRFPNFNGSTVEVGNGYVISTQTL